jgi:hypothetical protein
VVSFHLARDDGTSNAKTVAHIVPETRAPGQVMADEAAGGWVPPCYMWISDRSVLEALTDVADVIVATGLVALVDDCIRDRWEVDAESSRTARAATLSSTSSKAAAALAYGPRAFVQQLFQRRHAHAAAAGGPPPPRYARTISAY